MLYAPRNSVAPAERDIYARASAHAGAIKSIGSLGASARQRRAAPFCVHAHCIIYGSATIYIFSVLSDLARVVVGFEMRFIYLHFPLIC